MAAVDALRQERLARMGSATDAEIAADLERDAQGKFASVRRASSIKPVAIDWLWRGYLPLGALSLLYGTEGDGKSTFTMMLAAMVTRGSLPGTFKGAPANVHITAYEDDPGAVIVPRLLAAGADLDHVFLPEDDLSREPLTIPDDVDKYGRHLAANNVKLAIIDPLPDALREGLKDNNNGDVRRGLVPLNQMAQQVGAAVLGVTHPNKGATDAANKVMGSKAWRSVPRSVLLYGRDPDDTEGPTRIVAVSKANYAERSAAKVRVDSVDVPDTEHPQPRAQLVGASSYTDADVIAANAGAGRGDDARSKTEQARDLIYRLLEDGGGEIDARAAYAAGVANGIGEATMRRARRDIGAVEQGRRWVQPDDGIPVG
jgi:hypothetical protein